MYALLPIFSSVALFLILAGCQGRDHNNPLDPLNPDTGGTLDILNAIAGNGEVTLEWDDLGFSDLDGYDILRVEENAPESTLLNDFPIPRTETQWLDSDVINDYEYTYLLRLLTPDGEFPMSLPDIATPGLTTVWIVDFSSPSLRKISPDGRDIIKRTTGLSSPLDLDITTAGDAIWVADYYGGEVNKYDIEGEFVLAFDHSSAGWGLPISLDFNSLDNTLWIGGSSPDGVTQITSYGAEIGHYPTISYPIDIDISQTDGTVWVASRDDNAVCMHRVDEPGFTTFTGFNRPISLSVDPGSGRCWIADSTGVTVLNKRGDIVFSLENFSYPQVVAVDAGDGACWVADYTGSWSVSRVNASGDVELTAGNFDSISDMKVNFLDGTCWLTSVTATDGEVIKLSKGGEILGRVGRLSYPAAISILP